MISLSSIVAFALVLIAAVVWASPIHTPLDVLVNFVVMASLIVAATVLGHPRRGA